MKKLYLVTYSLLLLTSALSSRAMINDDEEAKRLGIYTLPEPVVNPSFAELKTLLEHGNYNEVNAKMSQLDYIAYHDLESLLFLVNNCSSAFSYAEQIGFGSAVWKIFLQLAAEVESKAEERRKAAKESAKKRMQERDAQKKAVDPRIVLPIRVGVSDPGRLHYAAEYIAEEKKKLVQTKMLDEAQQARNTGLSLLDTMFLSGKSFQLLKKVMEQAEMDVAWYIKAQAPEQKLELSQWYGVSYIKRQKESLDAIKQKLEEEYHSYEQVWGYDENRDMAYFTVKKKD